MSRVDDEAELIAAAYLSGESVTSIAARYGCSTNPVYRVLRERGARRRLPTEEAVVAAIRAWAEAHGRQPSWNDWRRSGPAYATLRLFGTWGNALVAAGFEALPPGDWRLPVAKDAFDEESARLQARVDAGETLGAISRELGVTGQSHGRRLRRWRDEYGAEGHRIPRRGRPA